MTLDEIAINHKTDKSTKYQGYTLIYPLYLDRYKDKNFKLLEIGVQEGKSLRMWHDYFPNAELFGIDLRLPWRSHVKTISRIFVGDQEDRVFLKEVGDEVGPFEVIIDDGGHTMNQQITSFEVLWPYIKEEGLYIIEDLDTSYREEFGGGLRKAGTTVEYMKNKLDAVVMKSERKITDIKYMHFYEELLFIGKK